MVVSSTCLPVLNLKETQIARAGQGTGRKRPEIEAYIRYCRGMRLRDMYEDLHPGERVYPLEFSTGILA